jgi:hypothetical protein
VDENVLARVQLAEHDQRLVRCIHASDIASGREDRRHAPVSQTSGMLAALTNERDAGFGMRCVAGDTMCSAYAPCGQDSLSATESRNLGVNPKGRSRGWTWPVSTQVGVFGVREVGGRR